MKIKPTSRFSFSSSFSFLLLPARPKIKLFYSQTELLYCRMARLNLYKNPCRKYAGGKRTCLCIATHLRSPEIAPAICMKRTCDTDWVQPLKKMEVPNQNVRQRLFQKSLCPFSENSLSDLETHFFGRSKNDVLILNKDYCLHFATRIGDRHPPTLGVGRHLQYIQLFTSRYRYLEQKRETPLLCYG